MPNPVNSTFRVLVVDDNMMIRQLVTSQLTTLGFKDIDKSINGVEAFTKLEEAHNSGRPYAIALLDWNMPEMNGLDFLKKCRADSRFTGLSIIMLTAESEQRNIMIALKAGATSYIIKPLTVEILEKKINQVVEFMTRDTGRVGGSLHAY